nr:FK506-binding protein 2-like [Ipomoea trifida]
MSTLLELNDGSYFEALKPPPPPTTTLVAAKKSGDVMELQIGVKYKPKTCELQAHKGDRVKVHYRTTKAPASHLGLDTVSNPHVWDIVGSKGFLKAEYCRNGKMKIHEADISRLSFAVELAEEFYGREAKVSSLMETNNAKWDQEILNDIFNEEDRSLILSIPIPIKDHSDRMIWAEKRKASS